MERLRLTPRALKALSLAPGPGDEHILLGLALEGGGVPARVLFRHGLGPEDIRGAIGTAPEVRDVVASAEAIARRYRHDEIGTEHLMLALVAEATSGPSRILREKGLNPTQLRDAILEILGVPRGSSTPGPGESRAVEETP